MSSEPETDPATVSFPGQGQSAEALVPIVYADLRRMAQQFFRREGANRTLQPTALVNEAYLRLADQGKREWENRAHFLAIAARCMRRVLVDAARERGAEKRLANHRRVTLHEELPSGDAPTVEVDILDLDQALERVGKVKARYLQLVELRFFGGLELEEIAQVLDVSRTMVVRDLAKARTWLTSFLRDYE